ncbi:MULTISPECIES: IucA/IucC family protein [Marinobacter]|jgi:siderophore synthetase component|uniref:IucA/IucC family protein n=1 Tax=Marinobacter TaxID=2742 RepID=UPI001E4A10CE|nr:IucA/IucC family protein [Marinobacter shengliensis]MCD1628750.1 IucA/IucC family protein [Marinobacter shengliensis]
MGPSARAIAEQASFQAFLHGYLQEIDPGHWLAASQRLHDPGSCFSGSWVCELPLNTQRARLAVDILYRSPVGRHRYGKVRQWLNGRHCWSDIEPFQAMCLLVRELYALSGGMVPELRKLRELEFLHRLTDSYGVMTRYLEQRRHDPRLLTNRFIDSEQSLLFGHATHPTPKSRQGMSEWQQTAYAPELSGRFRLHYFLVHQDYVEQDSDGPLPASTMAETLLNSGHASLNLPDNHTLVPAHPLQAQWLLAQPSVLVAIEQGLIHPLGALGPEFSATSSVRTVYSEQAEWMLKFSIPVKVTNSLRVNKAHELKAGVVMSRLIRQTGFAESEPGFRILQDPAYLTVSLPGQAESGFEVIFRNNPFTPGQDQGVISMAALTQDPMPGRNSRLMDLIEGLALNESRSMAAVSLDWFQHYLACAIGPALRLYDDHGIALEAHQQNSLLDIGGGYPRCYYYRDNQGYYLSETFRKQLTEQCPDLSETPELFYRDAMIRDRFCYYLIVNQVFSVIARFGLDGLIPESVLIRQFRQFLRSERTRLHGPARALVNLLLEDSRLPYKGNLLTRVHDVDELNAELEMAVYTSIANPLRGLAHAAPQPSFPVQAVGADHGAA